MELELARAAALDQLRHKLASFAAKAGLRNVPLLTFERWRFAAKWAEDEPQLAAAAAGLGDAAQQEPQGSSQPQPQQQQGQKAQKQKQAGKQSSKHQPLCDPVIPFGSLTVAPETGLVSDLIIAGVDAAAAVDVATQLAAAAAALAGGLVKKRQQLASGKAVSCGRLGVEVHKHSLDLTCGGMFVKISRPAYGKLARLYRQHWLTTTAAAAGGGPGTAGGAADLVCTVGLPPSEALAQLQLLQAASRTAAAATAADPPVKRHKATHETAAEDESDSGSGSDSEGGSDSGNLGPEGAAAAGLQSVQGISSKSGCSPSQRQYLDAEAQLAEVEQQQPDADDDGGGGGSSTNSSSSAREQFHARLFALLLRYKSIQGHGFQAAAGPNVFDLLRQQLSVGFECFASPLNAHFSRFGSAFPDVDAPFGSSGSFFRMKPRHGSYEVNPPFVPSILTAAAQHMLQLLQAAEADGGALGFVVLMPGWQEVPGWQLLNSSSFLRQSLLIAAADHGYCDGASHQRRDLYRQSPYDSSIMFLQTSAAAKKWPVSQQLRQELQHAFAACCPSAAAVERQKKQRGAKDLEARGYGVPVQKAAVQALGAAAGRSAAASKDKQKKKKKKKGALAKPQAS